MAQVRGYRPEVPSVATSIDAALEFLTRVQHPSGAFPVSSATPTREFDEAADTSTFGTAAVAEAIEGIADERAAGMRERAARFLLERMEEPALWRYRTRSAPDFHMLPTDVDDSAAAALVLRNAGIPFPDNRDVLLANRDDEGRFYTWLVPRRVRDLTAPGMPTLVLRRSRHPLLARRFWKYGPDPHDVDGVINVQVLAYLGDGPHADAVVRYAADILGRGIEHDCDKWYRSAYLFLSGVARCAAAGVEQAWQLAPLVSARLAAGVRGDGRIGDDVMDAAWAIRTIAELRVQRELLAPATAFLCSRQREDGAWDAEPMFFNGRAPDARRYGSSALTTGVCLGALSRAERLV